MRCATNDEDDGGGGADGSGGAAGRGVGALLLAVLAGTRDHRNVGRE